IESRLAALPELGPVASRVACSIARIEVAPGVEPDDAWRVRLGALVGKPLDADVLSDLLVAASEKLPAGARSLRVSARRASDGRGVALAVAFSNEAPEPHGGAWDKDGRRLPRAEEAVSVEVGRYRTLEPSIESTSIERARTKDGHLTALRALERCT